MKKLLLAVTAGAVGIGALIGFGFTMNRLTAPKVSQAEPEPAVKSTPVPQIENPRPVETTTTATVQQVRLEATRAAVEPGGPGQASSAPSGAAAANLAFSQAIETVLSPQASYEQKQAAWKQLKNAGQLDQAIGELERRVAEDPRSAEDASALGQAYLKKCTSINDIREISILAMKADKTFDAALNLDPSNWEARFSKASALAHWPRELEMGQEVVNQFQTLIQQQETQPPQSQFALSYLRLGQHYQDTGNKDLATQVWQRGMALFPDSSELKEKLSAR